MLRYVVNEKERRKFLLACHVDATAGHMAKSRTLFRLKERFMWHGMVKDVLDLVSIVHGIDSSSPPLIASCILGVRSTHGCAR